MRFFNNLRRSSGQSGEDFFQTVKLEDIQKGGDKYEDFLKFKKLDETRLEANERLKPVLRKIFDKIRLATAKDRALAGEGLDAYVFDSIISTMETCIKNMKHGNYIGKVCLMIRNKKNICVRQFI